MGKTRTRYQILFQQEQSTLLAYTKAIAAFVEFKEHLLIPSRKKVAGPKLRTTTSKFNHLYRLRERVRAAKEKYYGILRAIDSDRYCDEAMHRQIENEDFEFIRKVQRFHVDLGGY